MDVPSDLLARASKWAELKRWERRELGQELRRLGLSYSEIMNVIPVAQATLSGWCREVCLSVQHQARLKSIRPKLAALIESGRRRRLANQNRIDLQRWKAIEEVGMLSKDPGWVAGLVAYWAEGAKGPKPELRFANSDPALIQLFLSWSVTYLHVSPDRFFIRLHLHDGQDETERMKFWSGVTHISLGSFGKTFWKQEGTGHRKNVLYNGTASIRVARSAELHRRVMGWIEGFAAKCWAASSTG